jgi:hypothetical protein
MNPKLDFYSLLLKACSGEIFIYEIAHRAIEIYEAHRDEISLSDVTFENIELWHGWMTSCRGGEDPGIAKAEEIAISCFEDMAPQMRSQPVRDLHKKWVNKAGIPDDLFVHVRRSKDLGDGVATVTVVTDDIEAFRLYMSDPEKFLFAGEVHFSTAKEAQDPV